MDVHKIMCCKTSHVVKYDAMRHAVQVVRNVDEAKVIHDQAATLIAYARMRKDPEMSRWLVKIKLRADRRIGELSRELEKVVTTGGGKVGIPKDGKPKSAALRAAGISKAEANRCENA